MDRSLFVRQVLYGAGILLLAAVLGCAANPEPTPVPGDFPRDAGRRFDASAVGTIEGTVTWEGALPSVPPFEIPANPLAGQVFHSPQIRPNANAPQIEARSKGVANAVIFLRGIEPARGKPWDLPAVRVEQRAEQFHILQGESDSSVGFVQRGANVEMVSLDPIFHALHAGGANFFSLAFPDPKRPLQRVLRDKGVAELTSGAGYFWMRGYLFVDDHPYYGRTDNAGRFRLQQVPPGRYEVVCWLANWRKEHHERDPESGSITRYYLEKPLEQSKRLTLKAGDTAQATFTLSEDRPKPSTPK
jgi:hypothetical protein